MYCLKIEYRNTVLQSKESLLALYWTLSGAGFINCLVVETRSSSMFLPVTAARSPVSRGSLPTEPSRFIKDALVHPPHKKSLFLGGGGKLIKEVRSEVLLAINIELQPSGMRSRPVW